MALCKSCGAVKPAGDFYSCNQSRCKPCLRLRAKLRRETHADEVREYDRNRGFRGGGVRRAARSSKRDRSVYPERAAARIALGNAVRDGRREKPDRCEECREPSPRIHGHHDDYSKPLEVRWLCSACHGAWHRAENNRLRQIDRDAYSLVLAGVGAFLSQIKRTEPKDGDQVA